MVNYNGYNVFGVSNDYDISKVWRFAVVYERPEINGLRTSYDMNRINKLFKKNNVELTADIFASLMEFKSNLNGLDMFLKNLFANNGNKIKIKNMGVVRYIKPEDGEIDETGMKVISYIGILPTHEKKLGKKIGIINENRTKAYKV